MDPSPVGIGQVIALALIQGVTEFLPVSSSAHLILPSALTDWPDQGVALDVAVHCGTLLAVLAYFRQDLGNFAVSGWRFAARREWDANLDLLAKIALASVPVAVGGLVFGGLVQRELRSVEAIAAATVVFGLALWWADRGPRHADARTPTYGQALLIGLAQAAAIVPGASRSGVTIAAALALGLGRTGASRFAFLLAIPAIGGAAMFVAGTGAGRAVSWPLLGVGFAVAAASAFCCMAAFIRFVERTGMTPYVIYRVLLGLALLAFF